MKCVVIAKVGVRFLVKPEFFQILSPPLRLFIPLVVHFLSCQPFEGSAAPMAASSVFSCSV